MKTVLSEIVSRTLAMANCEKSGNTVWLDRHATALDKIAKDYLPHGSGFNAGTQIHSVTRDKVVLTTAFHHMDAMGGYDGWTVHKVICTIDFMGTNIEITGRNKNGIKEFMNDEFHFALMREVDIAE